MTNSFLAYEINKCKSDFGGTKIAFAVSGAYQPVVGNRIRVVLDVDIAHAHSGFKSPPLAQNPLVAIRHAAAVKVAFVPVAVKGFVQLERQLQARNVGMTRNAVHPEEMTGKGFARPQT